ncbi:peptidoglycan recognition family protein [Kribbella sp. NPDC050470]|uniref:peptidoglycan recognition protein family protein n=1 Tax=unclassified Kribbella TaxID=2644121 RepID=UPI003792AE39
MVDYLPRSAWNARPPNGGPGSLTVSRVQGAVIHWPGTSSKTPITSKTGVASALRGWQNYHMDSRGWSDIAYQVAVDQEGRAWTLRGLRTQSGANGNEDLNERYGAILLILIAGEQPSAKMKATVRAVIADFRKIYPKGTAIRPHSAVRPDGTDCPGTPARAAIARGDFTPKIIIPEDDMALSAEDKTWIESRLQAYASFVVLNRQQTTERDLNEIQAELAEFAAQLDRIEDDTDDDAAPKA